MIIRQGEFVEIPASMELMRTHMFRPAATGKYSGVVLYSKIFRITEPIRRAAAMLAGHDFIQILPRA